MKPVIAALGLASVLAAPAAAQMAVPCDWPARADALVEPWEDHTRTFANGEVRVALLDTIEPGAAALHLLVLSPPYDEMGARQCRTIGLTPQTGFAQVAFETLTAGYDPAVGLMFEVDVEVSEGDYPAPRRLFFTLNQSTGDIRAELQ